MGLDIVHYKATRQPTNERILVANWSRDCNVPIDAFSDYITDVPTLEEVSSVNIFENLKHLIKARSVAGDKYSLEPFLLRSDTPDLEAELRSMATELGVRFEDHVKLDTDPRGVRPYSYIIFQRRATAKGVFLEEVGYQRKGMDDRFHQLFYTPPYYLYFGTAWDFQRASVCVRESMLGRPGEDDGGQLKADFKRAFVDAFEEGRSLMMISY